MDDCILYAIWLKCNCYSGVSGAYSYSGKLYFTDNRSDMLELYRLFISSDYYKVSV